MLPRIGFVLEQALGHVAYGMSLRSVLSARTDIECEWLEVSFKEDGFARLPAVGKSWWLRGNVRARAAIARAHRRRRLDAIFVHTEAISLLSGDYFARIPTLLSLDATPLNYDELGRWYAHKVGSGPIEREALVRLQWGQAAFARAASSSTRTTRARSGIAWNDWLVIPISVLRWAGAPARLAKIGST